MSLYRRGETWWVCFTTPDGQRVRRSARTADKKQAQEYHDRLKVEFWRTRTLGEKPRRTWQEAVVRWINEKGHKADRDRDTRKFAYFDPFLGDRFLDEINRDMVDQIGEVKRKESSPATANRYLALLRAVLRAARDDWEWVEVIPRVRLYPEARRRVRWLTPEQAERLLWELPSHLADMARFTLATGLRQSNVSYLRWNQVALSREIAWVHADESKSRRAIAVPLNQNAMEVLGRLRGIHPEYVFTYQGVPVARTSTRAWKAALERAGIKDFRWHDLRHTWASWHVQHGTSLQELMELGGWSSMEMVLRYAHLAGDHLKAAARRIEDTNLSQPVHSDRLRLIINN